MSDDMTFCNKKDCKHTECGLHQSRIRDIWRDRSVADYENTECCLKNNKKEGKSL